MNYKKGDRFRFKQDLDLDGFLFQENEEFEVADVYDSPFGSCYEFPVHGHFGNMHVMASSIEEFTELIGLPVVPPSVVSEAARKALENYKRQLKSWR